MGKITRALYRLARLGADLSAVSKGPKGIAKRGINKGIGRVAGKRIYLKGKRKS